MRRIHSTAIVHPKAEIAEDIEIGAYNVVAEHVRVGAGTKLHAHVVLEPFTELGERNEIFSGAILGGAPQDRKFRGERSFLRMGDDNIIREYVTIHRASGEDAVTVVGNCNYIMAYSHLGHNCVIGSQITIANNVGVSGHCRIEDCANIGGLTGVHQKVRIGKLTMIGGMSRIAKDVPPFMIVEGSPACVIDINVIGLRRTGVNAETRMALHKAAKLLFRSHSNLTEGLEAVEREIKPYPEVQYLVEFMKGLRNGRFGRGLDIA